MATTSRPDGPPLRLDGICLDCSEEAFPATLDFYARFLGWEVTAGCVRPSECRHEGDHWACLESPAGGTTLSVQSERWYQPPVWPEVDGAQTKMMHLEIGVDDVHAAVARAIAAGARQAPHQPEDRIQNQLRIMLDPAGHPFCLGND
jgi:catechol 2,3-dioxygenase-like lactoylglutathione lyase family enzyme